MTAASQDEMPARYYVTNWPKGLRIAHLQVSSELTGFLDALKKDFRQATQVHSYRVKIDCPQRIARLGVRNEELCNRLGEKMRIDVGKDPTAINTAGQLLDEVRVVRLPPS